MRVNLREAALLRRAPLQRALPRGAVPCHLPKPRGEELHVRQDAEARALLRDQPQVLTETLVLAYIPLLSTGLAVNVLLDSLLNMRIESLPRQSVLSCRCERRCKIARSCGRHACKRRCCNGDCPPCDQVLLSPFFNLGCYCICLYVGSCY